MIIITALRIICLLVISYAYTSISEEEDKTTVRFSGIPALGYDSDTGFGAGVVGNVYWDEKGYDPYKMTLGIKAYLSTKLMNSHALKFERIRAFGLPWRLTGRLGFYSTMAQNYCGKASDALCDEASAQAAAQHLQIPQDQKSEFERHYFQNRFMLFYGDIFSRWLLWQDAAKLELMTGYHGGYYLTRDFKEKGPYPGSLFAKDNKNQKIDGYLSMIDAGLILHKRDIEAAPTSGYWLESSVRGGASFTGSAWDFFGINLTGRFYWPFDQARKFVVASQTIADVVFGDLPFDAMSRVGGSLYMNDFNAFGGQFVGRGIRDQHFVGRIKAIEQLEFRYNFWSFDVYRQHFLLTFAPFLDLGMAAWDFNRFTHDMKKVNVSFGSGLRALWNNTFVIRADLGLSPAEKYAPRFYLVVGNVF